MGPFNKWQRAYKSSPLGLYSLLSTQGVYGQENVREIPVWSKVMEKSVTIEMGQEIPQFHGKSRKSQGTFYDTASPDKLNGKIGKN